MVNSISESTLSLKKDVWQYIKPREQLSIVEAAQKHYYLGQHSTARKKGYIDLNYTPYLIEPLKALEIGNGVDEVGLKKPRQIGGTTIYLAFLIHSRLYYPMPGAIAFPTQAGYEKFVKNKFRPMILDCPDLKEDFGKKNQGTMGIYRFPNGRYNFVNIESSNAQRSDENQFYFFDEVSAFPRESDGQGSGIGIAKGSLSTYDGISKIYYVSTPTNDGECYMVAGAKYRILW